MKELGYIYLLDSMTHTHTHTHTHTYRFIYIYLTYAFGFDWTVGNISHGIKRIVMRQARVWRLAWHLKTFLYPFSGKIEKIVKGEMVAELRKFAVCLTWNDPKRNGTRLRKVVIHDCGMRKTTCQSNTVLSRYPKEGPAFKINHYGMFFISNSFWKRFLLVAQPACLST